MGSMDSATSTPPMQLPPVARFEPIAVVGVGIRGPGDIDSLPSLWDTLIQRKAYNACLSTDPRFLRRFDEQDFTAMFSVTPDAKTTLHGNLFDETPGLDEAYFGVNKRDSACMDAQLKLLLHVAHEALEDAGFSGAADGSAFDPASFGVYMAAGTDDFLKDSKNYAIDIYHLVRTQRAFLSGQISHHFGLRGPSVSVDTVCAGAMTAFNDACRALITGECRAALAGGVHVMSPVTAPPTTMALKLAGFLDPTGQCKPFLADGAGYCRAEACGIAVLKRLSDAIRDGDKIHGVIQGMGVGNMAAEKSIVRPDGLLQSLTLAKAVASSGIDPVDISFIEAHGPGTQQGDPAEIFSICSAIAQHGDRTSPLVIGSVKGNVGHSEAASGAISLFKVLAMMRYQRIPPQANFHVSKLNPRLQPFFKSHPIRISDNEQKWSASRRIAVVSNFGATGYSGHMVVEEPPTVEPPQVKIPSLPFVISAKDPSMLTVLARRYAEWLDGDGASMPLANISYSTTARRIVHPHFALLKAHSHADLASQLRDDALSIVNASSQRGRTLAFCFSGQGGPRLDPRLSSLYGVSTAFTSTVDTCFRLSETEQLFAPDDVEALELFSLQAGLAAMWRSWGVTPVALAGQSFGEYAALFCAGVLSLRDALMLVGTRASLVRKKCLSPPSKMAALRLPLSEVYSLLEGQKTTRVELACINAEDRVTLAGTHEDLKTFHEEVVKAHPTALWQLVNNMKAAFHSRFVEPLRGEFLEACKGVSFSPLKTVVLSGPLGRAMLPGDDALLQPDYLFRHCREANKFGKAILDFTSRNEAAGAQQPDWIEFGPHSTTVGFIPLSREQLKLPSHYKGGSGWNTTLDALITLRRAGHAIDFKGFHRDINPAARHIDMPRYPFRLQPHTYPKRRNNHDSSESTDTNTFYPRVKATEISPILKGHVVADHPICPASVYMAIVLAASVEGQKDKKAFRLSRFKMVVPFTNLSDDWLQARATLSSPKGGTSTFDVISKSGQVHASMQVDAFEESVILDTINLLKPLVLSMASIKTIPGTNVLNTRLAYDLFGQTVSYAAHCQGLRRIWISEDGRQACALSSNDPEEVTHRDELEPAGLRAFSPTLIDRACQLIGFLINTSPARMHDEIFVASEVDQVEIAWSRIQDSRSFESYASFELADKGAVAVGQVFTFDHEGRLVAAFRGVKMRRMKQRIVEHIVRMASEETKVSKPSSPPAVVKGLSTPILTPKEDDNESLNNPMREKVSLIVQSKLGGDPIPVDRKLAELGLDSLTAVELTVELGRLIPDHKLPGDLLAKSDTTLAIIFDALHLSPVKSRPLDASAVASKLSLSTTGRKGDSATSEAATSSSNPYFNDGAMAVLDYIGTNPEVLQDKPGTVPLMLIHDGGGTALAYHQLGDVGHTVLGIHNPRLREGKGIVSIRHAADEYASLARQWLGETPRGPSRIVVGGWSLGGLIALSLAASYPDLVSGVIILDSPPPGVVPMTAEEAGSLVPSAARRSSSGFSSVVGLQLKMNIGSVVADKDRQDGYQNLTAHLTVPVYLISSIEPLGTLKDHARTNSPNSCTAWFSRHDRAEMTESSWTECLGDLLIGSERSTGDHFTMFTPAHSESVTQAVRKGMHAIMARTLQKLA